MIPITEKIYAKGIAKGTSPEDFFVMLGKHLYDPPNVELAGKPKLTGASKEWREGRLMMGKRESRVHFKYHKSKGNLSLRIECNPRKMGPLGFQEFIELLAPFFDFKKLPYLARVTGLDVAVDVVGVHVSEIAAWYKKEGKRSLYVGEDGMLETINLHRLLPPIVQKEDQFGPIKVMHRRKPAGDVVFRIYDRVKERAAVLKPPPFGEAPVTRVEVIKERFKQKVLNDLPSLSDMYAELRVGLDLSQSDLSGPMGRSYLTGTRTLSPQTVVALYNLKHVDQEKLDAISQVNKPDLVAPDINWSSWKKGIEHTGLNLLVDVKK